MKTSIDILRKDTSLQALRMQFEVFRRIGIEGRARMEFDLSDTLRLITGSGVRQRHPEYTDEQVHLVVVRLAIGDELFKKVYPDLEIQS